MGNSPGVVDSRESECECSEGLGTTAQVASCKLQVEFEA